MPRALLVCLTLLSIPRASNAQTASGDPADLPLESLLTMEVTTASKFPEKLSGAPGVMSVVTQDELRRFGAMTVAEALLLVPGLQATSGFFTDRTMVAVRGDQVKETGSHVLILINGRPVREVLDGGTISDLLQSFPVNALERIEVIRGPGSVLYGTNAFSGVVNLITKKALGAAAAFRGFGAGLGGGGAMADVLYERGKLNVIAAAQVRFQPRWNAHYLNPLYPGSPIRRQGDFPVTDSGPGAYLGVNYGGLRFSGAYTDARSTYFLPDGVGDYRAQRGFLNLGYSWKAASRWDMSVDLTHSLMRSRTAEFPGIRVASSDTVLEWTNVVRLSSLSQVTFGALYNYIDGMAVYYPVHPSPVASAGTRQAPGFYAQIDQKLTGDLKLIAGFQSNKIGALDIKTVPRAGLVWNPAGRVHFKALYGKAFRAPSITETGLQTQSRSGNPALHSEEVGTFDFGVSYQAERFLAAVNYFDSRQTGIIVGGVTTYQNLDSFRVRGVEVEGKYYLSDQWYASATLLYNRPAAGERLPTPRWTSSAALSYQAKKALTLSVADVYGSAAPWNPFAANPLPTAHHQVQAHGRLRLERLFGEWAKGMAVFAHGDNLTGHRLWAPSLENFYNETIPFRHGRTLYYGIEVSLFRE